MRRKRYTKPVRFPEEMIKGLDLALDSRVSKKLMSRKDANYPSAIGLIGRMPEWKLALEKLSKLPKKEDLL